MYVLAKSLTLTIHVQEFIQLEGDYKIWKFILVHQEIAIAGFCSFWFRWWRWTEPNSGLENRSVTIKQWVILEHSWCITHWSISVGFSFAIIGITAWISKLQFDLCYSIHLIPALYVWIVIPTWLYTNHQPGVWSRQVTSFNSC